MHDFTGSDHVRPPGGSALDASAAPASTWLEDLRFQWDDLVAQRRLRSLRKNECLFAQGQPATHVYIVHGGRIRLALHEPTGRELHVAIVGASGLLGESGAAAFGLHLCSAYAATASSVYVVPREVFVHGLDTHPRWLAQARVMADRLLQLSLQHHWLLAVQGARQRVSQHLLGLVASYGREHPRGRVISITFSQQELADLCCISRVSVSQVWRELMREGVIAREGRQLVVLDLAALRRKAQ